jgi:hypothetical protein
MIGKLFFSIVLGLSLLACSASDTKKETVSSYKEERNIKNKNKISQEIENGINLLVKSKAEAVNNRDIEKYMSTVNEADNEYYKEQEHWFQDILLNQISDYKLELLDIESRGEDSYLVTLKQQYQYEGKDYNLKYKAIYKKNEDQYVDCDLDFTSFETEHFIIKYTDKSKGLLDKVAREAEEGYDIVKKNYGKAPEGKTVIKIYDDMETLRQSVKLSFQWDLAGWYEYGESIKYIGLRQAIDSRGFAHELIHKVTIEDSKNNMPYWFAEGLAAYYSEDFYGLLVKGNEMTIEQLENTNLEQLTKDQDILKYYGSAQCAVEFIVKEYGEEYIKKIINELSRHPFQEGTGSEVDKRNSETFNLAVKELLGKSLEDLDSEFEKSHK